METKADLRIGDGGGSVYNPTIFNVNSFVRCLSPQLDRTGPSLVFVSLEEDLSVILGPEGDASR
jgi:hypothetical protein